MRGEEMFPAEWLSRVLRDFRKALTAWRERGAVYAFSPELSEALREQAEKEISLGWPLLRLPCPALYIRPGIPGMADFFTAWEPERGRLRIVSEEGGKISTLCFSSARGSFEDGIREAAASCAESLFGSAFLDFRRGIAEKLLCLLYLSAVNADVAPQAEEAEGFRVVRVGDRVGAQIRELGSFHILEGRTRRPGMAALHIRKGHWHTYRLGSRSLPREEREVVLKWLPPEIVGSEGNVVQVVTLPKRE